MQGIVDRTDNSASPPHVLRNYNIVNAAAGRYGDPLAWLEAALTECVCRLSDLAMENPVADRLSGEGLFVNDLVRRCVGDILLHQLGDGDSGDVDQGGEAIN